MTNNRRLLLSMAIPITMLTVLSMSLVSFNYAAFGQNANQLSPSPFNSTTTTNPLQRIKLELFHVCKMALMANPHGMLKLNETLQA